MLALPAAASAQCSGLTTSGSDLTAGDLTFASGSGSTCVVASSMATADGAGTINSPATVNALSFNLLPPTYAGTPPNGVGYVSVTLVNSTSTAPTTNGPACWDTSVAGTAAGCSSTGRRESSAWSLATPSPSAPGHTRK